MIKTKFIYHIIDGDRDFWTGHSWSMYRQYARVFTEDGAHDLIVRRFSKRYIKPMVVSFRLPGVLKLQSGIKWVHNVAI